MNRLSLSKHRYLVASVCLLVGSLLYLTTRPSPETVRASDKAQDIPPTTAAQTNDESTITPPEDARLKRQPNGQVDYLPAIKISRTLDQATSEKAALLMIDQLLEAYRFAYKENPVGVENFEITEPLLGKNPMKIRFIDPNSKAVDGNQLVDTWGHPYFFHPVSGQAMEIRSAGPDGTLWTDDDQVLEKPTR